jgi:hypothetical protein
VIFNYFIHNWLPQKANKSNVHIFSCWSSSHSYLEVFFNTIWRITHNSLNKHVLKRDFCGKNRRYSNQCARHVSGITIAMNVHSQKIFDKNTFWFVNLFQVIFYWSNPILLILPFLGTGSYILFDSQYMSPAVVAASFHSGDVVLWTKQISAMGLSTSYNNFINAFSL